MPIETLWPKREPEVYPRVHKAGVRSINQTEVRAAGGQRREFPPEQGSGFPTAWSSADSGPWGACLRGDEGQARVPSARKQEGQQTEGLGKVTPPGTGGSEHPPRSPHVSRGELREHPQRFRNLPGIRHHTTTSVTSGQFFNFEQNLFWFKFYMLC